MRITSEYEPCPKFYLKFPPVTAQKQGVFKKTLCREGWRQYNIRLLVKCMVWMNVLFRFLNEHALARLLVQNYQQIVLFLVTMWTI
jgi:hypothetical protein